MNLIKQGMGSGEICRYVFAVLPVTFTDLFVSENHISNTVPIVRML
jgi:hypothetical protein